MIVIKNPKRKAKRVKRKPTEAEKLELKRKYDREYIRKKRALKKLDEPKFKDFDKVYRSGIVKNISKDDFSHLVTLTFNYDYLKRRLSKVKRGFKDFRSAFKELPDRSSLKNLGRVSIEFAAHAQSSYLNFLVSNNILIGYFSVIEEEEGGLCHIHSLVNINPLLYTQVDFYNFWIYGKVDIQPVRNCAMDKVRILTYLTDRLKATHFHIKNKN